MQLNSVRAKTHLFLKYFLSILVLFYSSYEVHAQLHLLTYFDFGENNVSEGNFLKSACRSSYRYCIVFTHNNLFRFRPTTSTTPMVEEVHALTDLFVTYNVNMVVNGHGHKRTYDELGNTTYIIMDALQDINNEASYLKLFINEKNIDFSYVGL